MINREKVIKGLGCCTSEQTCKGCPYTNECNEEGRMLVVFHRIATDALKLLKEQEVKTGYWNGPECSNCHAILDKRSNNYKYCPYCGAKMNIKRMK